MGEWWSLVEDVAVSIDTFFERWTWWESLTTIVTTLTMAANSSSVNTANIITALGNAFKDPSGAALPNDRLAAVLLQNMNQLNDLAKQGKLNQQQIMQVRS